jgi:hypothetical protein
MKVYPEICLEVLRETMNTPVRIADALAKIQTEYLPNTSLGRYCYTNLSSRYS